MMGYWNNPEATAAVKRRRVAGRRRPGEDEEGLLYITGRIRRSS
jgi:acyl-CoA synthetase (AMP-forming)/AMP-acid ligase II